MSATLIGNNVTLKVSAAIATSRTSNGTAYTAPANGYAIINLSFIANGGAGYAHVTVGGQPAQYFYAGTNQYVAPKMDGNSSNSGATGSSGNGNCTIYVGPSQVVATAGMSNAEVRFSGVEFVNSP